MREEEMEIGETRNGLKIEIPFPQNLVSVFKERDLIDVYAVWLHFTFHLDDFGDQDFVSSCWEQMAQIEDYFGGHDIFMQLVKSYGIYSEMYFLRIGSVCATKEIEHI